jgi:molybdopterin synthase catalytic subunit
MSAIFRLSAEPIDCAQERARLTHPAAGAAVVFEGWVREEHHGRPVKNLFYEAFAPLAEKEGARILEAARSQFSLLQVVGVHRLGLLEIGHCAIWLATVAPHRQAAYEANMWIMDRFKETVPIWKKETFADGESVWVRSAG